MKNTLSHTKEILKLNGEPIPRHYTAEISNEIIQGNKRNKTTIALGFNLTYLGMESQNTLSYRLKVDFRYFLNDKLSAIKKLNKAQKIAASVSSINNTLDFKLSKNFKILEVTNTDEIRIKWKKVKSEILLKHPDLEDIAKDFDWQLQENNIQQIYLDDNFYSFLFSNIFYQEFEKDKPIIEEKIISNGLGNLNIPILEEKKIIKKDIAFTNVTIGTKAKINGKHKKFPLAKLNAFIGDLQTVKGEKYNLDFNYKGQYNVVPQLGLVAHANLEYVFNIKDIYKKTTVITFNLESNE